MHLFKRAALKVANSLKLIALVYVISIFVGAVGFSIFEFGGHDLFKSVWWAQTTALTIGYGDLYPKTVPGMLLAMIIDHLWVMGLTPAVAANIFIKLLRSSDSWTHREQEWTMSGLEAIALRLGFQLPPQPNATNDGEVVSVGGEDEFVDE